MRQRLPNPNIQVRRLVHEMNTPLGVSTMVASMLPTQLDGILAALDAQSQDSVAELVSEWREATALLHSSLQLCVQILDGTRSANQTPTNALPLIDLQSTLQSAVAISLARQPDIQVQCQCQFAHPVQVHDDLGAWHQVLGNLVANSLLHGFAGRRHGAIRITGTLLPGQRVLVHYYDDGAGFSLQAFQRLFEDGFSTRLGTGGNGLGMGIARDLVQHKLGGRMEVHRPANGVHISIEACC
jgi:signal transduction histidine kinase